MMMKEKERRVNQQLCRLETCPVLNVGNFGLSIPLYVAGVCASVQRSSVRVRVWRRLRQAPGSLFLSSHAAMHPGLILPASSLPLFLAETQGGGNTAVGCGILSAASTDCCVVRRVHPNSPGTARDRASTSAKKAIWTARA